MHSHKGSAYEASYGESLRRWMSMSMAVVIQMKCEAVYKIMRTKEPNVHYKVGAFMQSFRLY
jgi:hypothetical protein